MTELFHRHSIGPCTVIEFATHSLTDPALLETAAQSLYKIIDEENHRRIVLDFAQVKYLSSQAIGIVLALHRKLTAMEDARLVVCGLGPRLMQMIKLTRLDVVLTIKPTRQDAVAAA